MKSAFKTAAFLAFSLLSIPCAWAGGAQVEIGVHSGAVFVDKVALFEVSKSSYAEGPGKSAFDAACGSGCLQVRTASDRRCYIPVKDLKEIGVDPVQLGRALKDPASGVWLSCTIRSIDSVNPFHGIATWFDINGY